MEEFTAFIAAHKPLVFCLLVIEIALKAVALWFAARRSQRWWYIALAVVSSCGILPIIYLLACQGKAIEIAKN